MAKAALQMGDVQVHGQDPSSVRVRVFDGTRQVLTVTGKLLKFHENDRLMVGGTNGVLVEPDIDLYRDLGAHGMLEVIPGLFPHNVTDPGTVYALRWMATKRAAGVPTCEPPYTIEQAG